MSSSRLPGKVLSDIEGKPMLIRQLERLRNSLKDIPIICLTSDDNSDDQIEKSCKKNNFLCFRGSLNNVLKRYIDAIDYYKINNIVRIGGDDPLVDPDACNLVIEEHKKSNADFIYTSHKNGWPFGTVCELISSSSLNDMAKKKNLSNLYQEHIIPWFHDNPNLFKIIKIYSPKNICRPNYYFSVDYPEDIQLIRNIYKKLKHLGDYFSFQDVINLCDEDPKILEINKHLHTGFDF